MNMYLTTTTRTYRVEVDEAQPLADVIVNESGSGRPFELAHVEVETTWRRTATEVRATTSCSFYGYPLTTEGQRRRNATRTRFEPAGPRRERLEYLALRVAINDVDSVR